MNNLMELENRINSSGWYGGVLEMKITLQSSFEGFYGRASESWEQQVTIEIIAPEDSKFKNIKIVGQRYETIDKVAFKVLGKLKG